MASFFATFVQNISIHIDDILQENELDKKLVIKDCLITDAEFILESAESFVKQQHTLTMDYWGKS